MKSRYVTRNITPTPSRYIRYKEYAVSVNFVDYDGKKFSSKVLALAVQAAQDFVLEATRWAEFFKQPLPEVSWTFITGSDTPEDKDSWEDVRYNVEVVGTDRCVVMSDFVGPCFFWTSKDSINEEVAHEVPSKG